MAGGGLSDPRQVSEEQPNTGSPESGSPGDDTRLGRRTFLGLIAAGTVVSAAGIAVAEMANNTGATESAASNKASHPGIVRVQTVYTPSTSGLLPTLIPAFETASGLKVQVTATNDVFTPAVHGEADLLIVHYYHLGQPGRQPGRAGSGTHAGGHRHPNVVPGSGQGGGTGGGGTGGGGGGGTGGGGGGGQGTGGGGGQGTGGGSGAHNVVPGSGQGGGTGGGGHRAGGGSTAVGSAAVLPGDFAHPKGASPGTINTGAFVLEGYGLWPMALFNNQALLVGPASDPAGVRGMASAAQAMAKIATTRNTFLASVNDVRINYLDELILAASGVPKGAWYQASPAVGTALLTAAAAKNAYTIWGDESSSLQSVTNKLTPMVVTDPVMQRMMVSIIVNPEKIDGVNFHGAHRFQAYLTGPSTQAAVLAFREAGFTTATFWPAASASA
ncbi:MAG TPA: hypothetical protein VK277_15830 [Acidimicrobiales bacterium]|nr:hypothetical protein [Acidimicrobiales bacterium]